jgi:ribosome-binding factor A
MSKPPYPRTRRVNSIIQQVIAEEVERLKEPRLGFVSITGVDTAPNFRNATVYFSTLPLEHAEETMEALRAAAPRLRRILGEQVRLKYTPALTFEFDRGVAEGDRIDRLLRNLDGEESHDD